MSEFVYNKVYFLVVVFIVMPLNGVLLTISFWYILLVVTQIPYILNLANAINYQSIINKRR